MSVDIDTALHVKYQKMLSEVADVVAAVDGLLGAFARPLEQATVFPVARVYPQSGVYVMVQNGYIVSQHTVAIEIMTERNYAPQDMEAALPLASLTAQALLNEPTLNGAVDALVSDGGIAPVRCLFSPLVYGGVAGLGWRVEVDYYVESSVPRTVPNERGMDLEVDYAYVDAIKELADICQTVNGLEDAFHLPTEQPSVYPFGAVFPVTSNFSDEDATTIRGIHNFSIEIHTARGDAPYDVDKILPLGPMVADKIMRNPKLNDSVDTAVVEMTYLYGFLGYGDVSTFGWQIGVNGVKQRLSLV